LGERLLCKQEVIGSIPFTSTIGHLHHRAPPPSPALGAGGARRLEKSVETPSGEPGRGC
jgi:hypothetical protein